MAFTGPPGGGIKLACLGDWSNFSTARPKKRRVGREVGTATGVVGAGSVVGGVGTNRLADVGYRQGYKMGYKSFKEKRPRLARLIPQRLVNSRSTAKGTRRVVEAASKKALRNPSLKLGRQARLGLMVLAKPGRAGAIAGAGLAAGGYGAYRGGKYGVRKLRRR